MSRRIADYGLVGDGRTAALVANDGAVEWLCLPRFDSPACLSAMLGDKDNGCWRIAPAGEIVGRTRRYRGESLVLETDIACNGGTLRITDFMPPDHLAPTFIRIAECIAGKVSVNSELFLRFDYGRMHPVVHESSDTRVLAVCGPDAVALDCEAPVDIGDRRFAWTFELHEGERKTFALTWYASEAEPPDALDADCALERTLEFWKDWTSSVDTRDRSPEAIRSLITLKAMIHRPTGGIVASPTASLPERLGGQRNWDYRYCWLRDATFALLAFLRAGLRDEAREWIAWLRRAVGGEPVDLQPFYTVTGGPRALEWEAGWLGGFAGSQPVRFGNGAQGQLQLDIFGEVVDCLYQARQCGIDDGDVSGQLVRAIVSRLEEVWQRPDAGIWESRGEPRNHTYSKVMCWVAFDRASGWWEDEDPAESARYHALAEKVRQQVLELGFDTERNTFVRAYGDAALDAAALRIPLVGFLPADDPRMRGTVEAIERDLYRDGFVRRYDTGDTDDGVGGAEGAFVATTLWLADVYFLQGREDEAHAILDLVLARSNDLGLIAEEVSLTDGSQIGNFPQALSHLSIVTLADRLAGGRGNDRAPAGGKLAAPSQVDEK